MEELLNQLYQPILEAIQKIQDLTSTVMVSGLVIGIVVILILAMVSILAYRINKLEGRIEELLKK